MEALEQWLVEIEELHGSEIGGAVVDDADGGEGKGEDLTVTMAATIRRRPRCKPQLQPPRQARTDR